MNRLFPSRAITRVQGLPSSQRDRETQRAWQMSEEELTGTQVTGQRVQLVTPRARSSRQTGSDCKADPHGLLERREWGSCPGIPPLCNWHYLGRHAKRPKIKRTTLPEPSPSQAAGYDTTKGQQEEGRSGYCKHHG